MKTDSDMLNEALSRSALMLGEDKMKKLAHSRVMVCGLGGVGAASVEALARMGLGQLQLVDSDCVSVSNLNRQLIATKDTLGRPKAEVAAERVAAFGTGCEALPHVMTIGPDTVDSLPWEGLDYVIDAIDTVTAKLALIAAAQKRQVPVISCMGTGNKLHAERFVIAPIEKTSVCPLARVMRTEAKKRGLGSFYALYSPEIPVDCHLTEHGRHAPGSVSFVPPVAGMLLAGHVLRQLMGLD